MTLMLYLSRAATRVLLVVKVDGSASYMRTELKKWRVCNRHKIDYVDYGVKS
jgi:hypothetical protein